MNNKLIAFALGVSLAFIGVQPAAGVDFQPWFGKNPADLVWKQGDFDYVGLQPAEAPASNAQPLAISPEDMWRLLASVQLKDSSGKMTALFSQSEAAWLAPALSQALGKANAQQDVVFFSSDRRGLALLSPRLAVTARAFSSQGTVNLIVGTGRLNFFDLYRGGGVMPPFSYGSRTKPAPTDLQAEGASYPGGAERRDWIAWQVAEAGTVKKAADTPAAPRAAPVEGAAPAERAAPGVQRDDRFYDEQEQRLRRLQRLRDQGLITEQEYQEKRKEILRDL